MLKKILVIGTADDDLRRIEDQLRDEPDLRITTLRFTDSTNGALLKSCADVDLIIVCCLKQRIAPLEAIAALNDFHRPPILVSGDIATPEATRLMVRLGVRDLLPPTPTSEELHNAVHRALRTPSVSANGSRNGEVIGVVGAAGGVGASFIACNLAHLAVLNAGKKVLLIDLDLLYAPISTMLGLHIERSFTDAREQASQLDALALDGYTTHHASGLKLMSSTAAGAPPRALNGEDLATMLSLARQQHDLIFVAVNRWLDSASVRALSESKRVLMVMGPTLSDVRNGVRLRGLLCDWLGVQKASILPVINRFSSRTIIRPDDVAHALDTTVPVVVPEDIEFVRRSIDSGVPVAELQRSAALVASLRTIEEALAGTPTAATRHHPIRQLVSDLFRS